MFSSPDNRSRIVHLSTQAATTRNNKKEKVDLSMKLNRIPTRSKTEVEKRNKHHIKNTSPEVSAASLSSTPSKHRTNDYDEHKQKPSENRIKKMSTMNAVSTSEAPRYSTFSTGKLAQTHMDPEEKQRQQQHSYCKGISDHDDHHQQKQQQQYYNESEENLPERENLRLVSLGPYSHLDSISKFTPPPSRRKSSAHYIKPLPPRVPPKPLAATKSVEYFTDQENIGNSDSSISYNPVVFREKIENFERNFSAHSFDGSGSNGFKVFYSSNIITSNISSSNNNNNNRNENRNLNLTDHHRKPLTSTESLPLVNGGGSPRILRYDSFGRRKDVIDESGRQNGITSANNNTVNSFNNYKNKKNNLKNQRTVNSSYSSSAKDLNSSMLINDIDQNIYSLSEENIYNSNNNNNNNCEVISACNDEVNECNCGVNSHKSLEGLSSSPIRAPETIEVEVSFRFAYTRFSDFNIFSQDSEVSKC